MKADYSHEICNSLECTGKQHQVSSRTNLWALSR